MKRALVLVLLAACATTPGVGAPGGGDPGSGDSGGSGTPQDPQPQGADKGPYQVTSTVDLTVEAIVPAQVELVVATLREFSMNPAHALIDLASQAGVPAVGTLYNALPSALTDKLEGWINGEIAKVKVNGEPITQYAGDVAALFDTALTKFDLDSTLAFQGAAATHTLTAIDFSPAGIDAKLTIPSVASVLLTANPTIDLASGGALTIGDEHFGFELGEYAWDGVNAASTALFGGDLQTTLTNAIDCPQLAQTIAGKCVLGVCVGHASDLQAICDGGIGALVNAVHDQLAQFNTDAFHFAQGTGTLVDDDGDGVADRIVNGTWTAEMNLGMGLRHTPATFTATR